MGRRTLEGPSNKCLFWREVGKRDKETTKKNERC
jgi:hypothetical protein